MEGLFSDIPAYVWLLLGFALLIAEMLTGTFFIMFFGVAAIVVAAAKVFGLNDVYMELLLFGVVGTLLMFIFPAELRKSLRHARGLKHEKLELTCALPAGQSASTDYQGARWKVKNISGQDLPKGAWVKVVGATGITLKVVLDETGDSVNLAD